MIGAGAPIHLARQQQIRGKDDTAGAAQPEIDTEPFLPDEPAESDGGPLALLALRLHNEFRSRDSWSGLAIEGLTLEMMAELARCSSKQSEQGVPRWLDEVKQKLASRIAETPPLAALAASAGVHPVHFARVFRAKHECTEQRDWMRQEYTSSPKRPPAIRESGTACTLIFPDRFCKL